MLISDVFMVFSFPPSFTFSFNKSDRETGERSSPLSAYAGLNDPALQRHLRFAWDIPSPGNAPNLRLRGVGIPRFAWDIPSPTEAALIVQWTVMNIQWLFA
ncbi:MAG: hypothetical protein LIP12_13355 [Clostridiales bacterium]|nr:hypothetical protein [Clostridiales bacterium]